MKRLALFVLLPGVYGVIGIVAVLRLVLEELQRRTEYGERR